MNFKDMLKHLLSHRNITMTELVHRLNEKHNRNDSLQNLANKLRKETIRFTEVLEIIDILGYSFDLVPKGYNSGEDQILKRIEPVKAALEADTYTTPNIILEIQTIIEDAQESAIQHQETLLMLVKELKERGLYDENDSTGFLAKFRDRVKSLESKENI